jgi:hypothetical protein
LREELKFALLMWVWVEKMAILQAVRKEEDNEEK